MARSTWTMLISKLSDLAALVLPREYEGAPPSQIQGYLPAEWDRLGLGT
jgi:hypothetical protein